MYLLAASLLSLLPAAAAAAPAEVQPLVHQAPVAKAAPFPDTKACPRTTSRYAYRDGKPLMPRKLTELPPAQGFMAVYRVVNGCEEPMTMVEYRTGQRR